MALTKYASFEVSKVLDIKSSPERVKTASLKTLSDFHNYRTEDGYLYVRLRAISSRTNKNHDGWPTVELAGGKEAWDKYASQHTAAEGFTVEASKDSEYGFSTFLGKPHFVDHHNSDPKRARGVVVDSKFHVLPQKTAATDDYWGSEDVDPEHFPPSEVELLVEVDAQEFPKYAKAIVDGDIDGFSMGCDVDYSKCSHCGHQASSPDEYCSHIVMKGAEHTIESGRKQGKTGRSYENCYGIKFFEISGVFDPADETALAREVRAGVYKESQPEEPQSFHTTAPEDVDTLRQEKICPLCGSDMDAEKCDVCGYEEPPEQLQNPDLQKAQETDELTDQADGQVGIPADPGTPGPGSEDAESYLKARNPQPTAAVKSDMRWEPQGIVSEKLASAPKPQGDEPNETVTSDQTKPVTSAFRTATQMIAAAKRNQENNMSDRTKVAADPADSSGKPDKRVDVTGVGGVDEASNEQASKAEGAHSWENKGTQVDVTGKGGVLEDSNQEASEPSAGKESLPTAGKDGDDAGFNKDKTVQDSGKTRTFDNSNEPGSAVTDKAFPTAAKKGTDPADAVGKPDKRVDVEEQVNDPSNNSGPTSQWTGTDGNGVTRQADPVTQKPTQSGGIKASGLVSLAALKLADAEVELGITTKDNKYNRLAELADLSDVEIAAELRAISKVKTAGLTRTASKGGVSRLPSFSKIATEAPAAAQPVNDALLDSALYG
jgi:hypothetical protein